MYLRKKVPISFRCFFPSGDSLDKVQELYLDEISRWIDAYLFTHPCCCSISVKISASSFAPDQEVQL